MVSGRQEEYRKALEIAKTQLLRFPQIRAQCRTAGAEWERLPQGGVIHLPFFNTICEITIPAFEFRLREGSDPISLSNKVLIVHYLNGVKDIPLASRTVSFKDIPSGSFYYPAFRQRSITPLLMTFGHDPQALERAAKQLGGEPARGGDLGVKLQVFPKAPVTLLFWYGDEEFPPDLTVLFDETIQEFLSTEDITVMSQEVMVRMIRSYSSGFKNRLDRERSL
jgi:hypothetical protein